MTAPQKWLPHPLAGSSLLNLGRLLRRHAGHVEPRYWPGLLTATAAVAAATPVRVYEQLRHHRRIARQTIDHPPVMILGHWRSGTTNLHNLLLCNKQFASVSLLHCSIPHLHLTLGALLSRILNRRLGTTRPMDAVPLGIHEPMSEDFGLVGCSDQTHYGSYFFPQHAEAEFRRTVLFEEPNRDRDIRQWKHAYAFLLRKVTYESQGKQLCLKNPPNTGRIPQVLELFPDARFVFVKRNPYVVHASTCRLMEQFLKQFALQAWHPEQIQEFVSRRYQLLMQKWFSDRESIPEKNLIELSHEDITANTIQVIESVYSRLALTGFDEQLSRLHARVDQQTNYQPNEYQFTKKYLNRIEPYVGPAAQAWGYSPPSHTCYPRLGHEHSLRQMTNTQESPADSENNP